jgi:hypothetical protein
MDPIKNFIIFCLIGAVIFTSGCTGEQSVIRETTISVSPQHTYISPPSHIADSYQITVGRMPDGTGVMVMNNGTAPVTLTGWILFVEPENRGFTLPVYSLDAKTSVAIVFDENGKTTDRKIVIRETILRENLSQFTLHDERGILISS